MQRGVAYDWPLVFSVLRAADYLGVAPLVSLSAATIAARVRGMTEEQADAAFSIGRTLTAEEEDALRASNAWVSAAVARARACGLSTTPRPRLTMAPAAGTHPTAASPAGPAGA